MFMGAFFVITVFPKTERCPKVGKNKKSAHDCERLFGAGNQNRTDDLVITNDVLYRLSHTSTSENPTLILYQTDRALSRDFGKKVQKVVLCGVRNSTFRTRFPRKRVVREPFFERTVDNFGKLCYTEPVKTQRGRGVPFHGSEETRRSVRAAVHGKGKSLRSGAGESFRVVRNGSRRYREREHGDFLREIRWYRALCVLNGTRSVFCFQSRYQKRGKKDGSVQRTSENL